MKTWTWILAAFAVAVLLFAVMGILRERFEATPSIKAPPYDGAEKERIYNMVRNRSATPPYTVLGFQDMLMARAKSMNPNEQNERKLQEFAGGLVSPAIESFFTTVYKPATTPITEANIDSFMLTRTSDLKDVEKHILTTYFIGQSGVGRTGKDSYTERLAAEGLAQNFDFSMRSTTAPVTGGTAGSGTAGSGTAGSGMSGSGMLGGTGGDIVDAKCPDGSTPGGMVPGAPGASVGQCGSTGQTVTCPSGFTLFLISAPGGSGSMKCVRNFSTYAADFSQGPPPRCTGSSHLLGRSVLASGQMMRGEDPKCIIVGGTGGSGTTAGTTTAGADPSRTSGSTTGGTSGTTRGPNSGGGGIRRQQVFGPLFMGQGEGQVQGVDSSTTNRYPELLGGNNTRPSTRIEGGGIVAPSGVGVTLPTLNSLGLNENSSMFPFSRSPGDMETIPDPFRVSQQFSASSYSSKTEPVPFLTDFSAFQS